MTIEKWRWWEEVIHFCVHLFVVPELLGIMLVVVLPLPIAFFWHFASFGLLARWLCISGGGLVVWASAIITVFMPRYRGR